MANIDPVVKWAGGKRNLISKIKQFFPSSYGDYYEPFVGGGAIALSLSLSKRKILGDLNQDLIIFYKVLRDKPDDLYLRLMDGGKLYSPDHFAKVQSVDRIPNWRSRLSEVEQAARFLYLNRGSFNGLWRVNRSGHHNTGYGKYKELVFNYSNLDKVSNFLSHYVELRHATYADTLSTAKAGDLVYLDPPYDPLESKEEIKYNSETLDQKDLAATVWDLKDRGCHVVLSNSDTPLVRGLYESYTIVEITARRSISGNGDRTPAKEVIVLGNL